MLASIADTLWRDVPVGIAVNCPDLKVTIDAALLRYCLPGPAYTVGYCNQGTAETTNAYVEIALERSLVLDSASAAYTSLGANRYRFNVGTLGINDCGSFQMHIRISCADSLAGQAHCVEAFIFPDSICIPTPTWDGARLQLETECQPDSLLFRIINTGSDMGDPKSFIIIQDDVLYVNGQFHLNGGGQFVKKVPANGSTWTFITEQTNNFPGNRHLVKSIERCGLNVQGGFSVGYLMQYPQSGPSTASNNLCLIGVASYDPNDKAAEPKGLGLEGAIDKSQQLHYRIRFQNTGTDTAFTVVIQDTLSMHLDLATIRNFNLSHPAQISVLPNRLLQFTFSNILLPDSNANEPASHGFVSFDIDLVEDLPIGTPITNTAYIYFDVNAAVVTNTVLNTIGELYKTWLSVTELVNPENRVSFYPNPTQGMLHFSIEGNNADAVDVVVFDIQGRQMLQRQFRPGQPLQMDVAELSTGTYLMQVKTGTYHGTYRVVVSH